MIQIKTMNAISPVYEESLPPSAYAVGPEEANPQAILVRSADLHAAEIPDSLLCVARAGAGYNNLPIDVYARKGVVAFNTPGANANAVKELTGFCWPAGRSPRESTGARPLRKRARPSPPWWKRENLSSPARN